MEGAEQGEGDVEGEGALELAVVPVHDIGTNSLELGEEGVDDSEIEIVAKVDPDADEAGIVGTGEEVVQVVERLGGLERHVALVSAREKQPGGTGNVRRGRNH